MKQTNTSLAFSLLQNQKTERNSLFITISNCMLAILFFIAIGGGVSEIIVPQVNIIALIIIGAVGCIVFTNILPIKRFRKWGLIITAVWIIIFCLVMYSDMLNGLRLTANNISDVLGNRFGMIYPSYFVTVEPESYKLCGTLFFVPISIILSLLSSYLAYAKDAVISLSIAAVLFFINIFLAVKLSLLWIIVFVIAQIILLAQAYETKSNFYRSSSSSSYIKASIIALVTFSVFAVIATLAISNLNDNLFSGMREGVIRNIDNWRYGVNTDVGMPDGDFKNLGPFEPTKDTALEITMEKPESLWLRGYVGSDYTGMGWKPEDSSDLYKNSDLFYWLHADNFFGQNQLANATLVSGADLIENSFAMRINNIGASSRNIYAPYEVHWTYGDLMQRNKIGDSSLTSSGFNGTRKYEYTSMPNQVKRYPDTINSLYGEEREDSFFIEPYLVLESNYAEYVYEQYVNVPEKVEEWIKEYLIDVFPSSDEMSFASVKQAIVKYLTEEITYSTNPNLSGSGDIAHDFLLLDKEGYSVHYATTATLMFRYAGIPARYVEGYLITPEDVEGVSIESVFNIDGTHAHAWVEVYQDGVGWIPVEVTPPYFGVMEEADSLKGVPGASNNSGEGVSSSNNIEDQIDRPEVSDLEAFVTENSWWMLLLIGLLVLVIIGFLLWKYHKKRYLWLQEMLAACFNESNSKASHAMFSCSMNALTFLGFKEDGIWLIKQLLFNSKDVKGLSEERYAEVFKIYEEATYSKNEVDDEKRKKMELFFRDMLAQLKEGTSGMNRLKANKLIKLSTVVSNIK